MGFIIAGCVLGTSGIVTLPGGGVLESENGLYSSSPGGTFLVTCVTDGSWNKIQRRKKGYLSFKIYLYLQSICFICMFGHPAKLTQENKDYQIYSVPFPQS